jgi:hypothetical protein
MVQIYFALLFPGCLEPEGSFVISQEHITGSYPKPDESIQSLE